MSSAFSDGIIAAAFTLIFFDNAAGDYNLKPGSDGRIHGTGFRNQPSKE